MLVMKQVLKTTAIAAAVLAMLPTHAAACSDHQFDTGEIKFVAIQPVFEQSECAGNFIEVCPHQRSVLYYNLVYTKDGVYHNVMIDEPTHNQPTYGESLEVHRIPVK